MAVMISERAAEEFRKICDEQELGDMGLRIGILAGGCSGFSYQLVPEKDADEKADTVKEQHGVRVIVDKKSALYLDGTTVDFHEDLNRRGFTFNNPNAVKSCGCGSSFQA